MIDDGSMEVGLGVDVDDLSAVEPVEMDFGGFPERLWRNGTEPEEIIDFMEESSGKKLDGQKRNDLKDMLILSGLIGGFTALGGASALLKDADVFSAAVNFIGRDIPELVRNHGGDMFTTSFAASACLVGLYSMAAAREGSENFGFVEDTSRWVVNLYKAMAGSRERAVSSSAWFGIISGLYYGLEEFSRIFPSDEALELQANSIDRIFTTGTLRGDIGDVLSYGVPVIAGTLYFMGKAAKGAVEKVRGDKKDDIDPLE